MTGDERPRLGRQQKPRLEPSLRRAIEKAVEVKDESLLDRLIATRLSQRDIDDGLGQAIRPLVNHVIERAMSATECAANESDDSPEIEVAVRAIQLLNEGIEEEDREAASWVFRMIANTGLLEGFVLGVIFALEKLNQDQKQPRRRPRPGR